MNKHNMSEVEIEEPALNKKSTTRSWFQRIINLNDLSNQKQHRSIFIIFMSILHVFIHFSTYLNINWRILFQFCRLCVPCVRPTSEHIRTRIVSCPQTMTNETCHYDDVLKDICFSFIYPYQLWRLLTVNLFHIEWLHLLSNLLAQLLSGVPLERKYGSLRVIVIYWLSGLGASLIVVIEGRQLSATGASGSLYGLMLFLIVDRLIAIQTNTDRRLFIIVQLAFLLLPHFIVSIPLILKYNVAHLAHVGGGLVGFLLGVTMLGSPWLWNNEDYNCQIICRRIAFSFFILYYVITFTLFFLKDAPVVNSILFY